MLNVVCWVPLWVSLSVIVLSAVMLITIMIMKMILFGLLSSCRDAIVFSVVMMSVDRLNVEAPFNSMFCWTLPSHSPTLFSIYFNLCSKPYKSLFCRFYTFMQYRLFVAWKHLQRSLMFCSRYLEELKQEKVSSGFPHKF